MSRIVIKVANGQVAGVVSDIETEVIILDTVFGQFFMDTPATPNIITPLVADFEQAFEGYHE